MQAANAPTPGTTSPSHSSAASRSAVTVTVGAGTLESALGRADVARAVVEDDDVECSSSPTTPTAAAKASTAATAQIAVAEPAPLPARRRIRRRGTVPPTKSITAWSWDYNDPFVLGTPTTRGSTSTAVRSARANALNCVSTTWWALRPAST